MIMKFFKFENVISVLRELSERKENFHPIWLQLYWQGDF